MLSFQECKDARAVLLFEGTLYKWLVEEIKEGTILWGDVKAPPGSTGLSFNGVDRSDYLVSLNESASTVREVLETLSAKREYSLFELQTNAISFAEFDLVNNPKWPLNRSLSDWANKPRSVGEALNLLREKYGLKDETLGDRVQEVEGEIRLVSRDGNTHSYLGMRRDEIVWTPEEWPEEKTARHLVCALILGMAKNEETSFFCHAYPDNLQKPDSDTIEWQLVPKTGHMMKKSGLAWYNDPPQEPIFGWSEDSEMVTEELEDGSILIKFVDKPK